MSLTNMIHPERTPLLLTTDELTEAIPDFNWEEGHSGEILSDSQADKLEDVWKGYIERTHAISTSKKEFLPNAQKGTLVRIYK